MKLWIFQFSSSEDSFREKVGWDFHAWFSSFKTLKYFIKFHRLNRLTKTLNCLSKLLELWNFEIFHAISTEPDRESFTFFNQLNPCLKPKQFKIYRTMYEFAKKYIILKRFIYALKIWSISSNFIHEIGSRKGWNS